MNRIIIDGDQARLYGVPKAIPTGQVGFSKIGFEFSPEWDGMTKIAQFMQGENKYNVAVENNECTCPNGLVKGWVSVRVRGYSETDVIATANEILLPVSTGFQSGGIPPIPPTPDLYQQFLKATQSQIGDLADLTTEEKENLVAAINEVALVGGRMSLRVADIVNNLTTNISNKPLSAAQGVALKELIDALSNSMTAYRTAAAQDVIDSGKVDKVTGKGLSSNDYTDAAKAKVDALAPIATSGNYNDLSNKPTIPTAYDDTEVRQRIGAIEAKESTWDAKSNFSGNYDDLTNKPTIPAPVTEQTVSGWGFTKNTGTYSKPTGGIPKTDLAAAVQASLGKADTALQEHQSLAAYRTAAAQDIIDNDKQDKITSTNKLAYSLISGTPTIPTVPTNVSAFTNDAGYLTLATLPKYEGVVE